MKPSVPNRFAGVAVAAVALATVSAAAASEDEAVARGAYLFRAANCLGCHTDRAAKGAPLAGGRALRTPFGTFYSPNITPDRETGIGAWGEDDFRRAMTHGLSPTGAPYYPVFPYPSFTRMTDADVADLWAFLRTVPAVRQNNKVHRLDPPFGWRPGLRIWRSLYFDPGPAEPPPQGSKEWRRGRYLVAALGHCGECHTPRGRLGNPLPEMEMAGSADGAEGKPVPNITPDVATGIGDWSARDIAFYLETGFRPDGDVAGGIMAEIIETSTSHLTAADRAAIAVYLKGLASVEHKVKPAS